VTVSREFDATFQLDAGCPAGKKVVGGGHNWTNGLTDVWIWQSAALDDASGWRLRGNVDRAGSPSTITAFAICMTAR